MGRGGTRRPLVALGCEEPTLVLMSGVDGPRAALLGLSQTLGIVLLEGLSPLPGGCCNITAGALPVGASVLECNKEDFAVEEGRSNIGSPDITLRGLVSSDVIEGGSGAMASVVEQGEDDK